MSKHDKTLLRLSAKPTPADIKWDELTGLLMHLGYTLLNNKGSRRKFHNSAKDDLIICHEPHGSANVDKGCVNDVAEHLRECNFIK